MLHDHGNVHGLRCTHYPNHANDRDLLRTEALAVVVERMKWLVGIELDSEAYLGLERNYSVAERRPVAEYSVAVAAGGLKWFVEPETGQADWSL